MELVEWVCNTEYDDPQNDEDLSDFCSECGYCLVCDGYQDCQYTADKKHLFEGKPLDQWYQDDKGNRCLKK